MKDYYKTLGIHKQASVDEVKRAYRRLASQHHPDKGGDKNQFQEIQEAYSVLGDEQKRREYDNPQPKFAQMNFNPGGFDLDQLFSMFGAQHAMHSSRTPRLNLWIGLRDVAEGGSRTVALQINHTVENIQIDIPQGLADGDTIRYPRAAPGGHDLIITFRVRAEPGWTREGQDITTEIDVDLYDFILGGQITITDIRGRSLLLTVPPGTQPGALLRMRGQGLPPSTLPGRAGSKAGDMLVRVRPRMPKHFSDEFLAAVKREAGR